MVIRDLAFGDDVINTTQLTRNWSHWAKRAQENPVTILYKDAPITLLNRRYISELNQKLHYTHLILNVFQFVEGRIDNCDFLPWMVYLKDDMRQEFLEDALNSYMESSAKNNWAILQETLDDWMATAEVASSPKLSKRLLERDDPSQYVEIKG